jgi:hypothetical protein
VFSVRLQSELRPWAATREERVIRRVLHSDEHGVTIHPKTQTVSHARAVGFRLPWPGAKNAMVYVQLRNKSLERLSRACIQAVFTNL